MIDVDGSGFTLTDLTNGTAFDIAALGKRAEVSWISPHSTNGWLALDRNGNGTIDDGTELFGDVTPQPEPPKGNHKNGFLALAEFDKLENGGNEDGIIDKNDAVFSKLLVWQDLNHDGISQPDELKPLSAFDITAIDLHYETSRHTDEYGNVKWRCTIDPHRNFGE